MRIIAKFHKRDELRFISHLDIQRLVQRAMRRARIPMLYSQGFNPHPLLAFASALAVGYTSGAEWLDVKLEDGYSAAEFPKAVNVALPEGLFIEKAFEIDEKLPTLTALICSASYRVTLLMPEGRIPNADLQAGIETLMSGPILVMKRTKGGIKEVDIRPHLISMQLEEESGNGENTATLAINGVLNAAGGLQVELLMRAYMEILKIDEEKIGWRVHRTAMEFDRIEV